jgi:hypothetical protein
LFKALKGFIHEFTCPTTTTIIIYIIKGLKMKLKFTKSIIENNLSITTNFIEKKDNSQITSHILLEADEYLTIKATDKEFGIILTDKSTQIIEKGKSKTVDNRILFPSWGNQNNRTFFFRLWKFLNIL